MSKNEANKHQLRLSIDIRSIKDHDFTAQLYLKYSSIPELSIENYRSATQPIVNPKVQCQFNDIFSSYHFQAQAADITSKLERTVKIQLWHSDRLKNDVLLGVSQLNLGNILDMPLRKTSESYARVFDVIVPVDDIDKEGKSLRQIGSLRVVTYLQDMGPVKDLQKRGFNIRDLVGEDVIKQEVEDPQLPSQHRKPSAGDIGDPSTRMQLNQLETKVVWELETWKKAEQAKTRITLKQKQIQFWTNISEQQRKSDLEKEKQFKKMEANLNLLDNKLRAKMTELTKRQQKIVVYEQQLQNKINQISKQCLRKDEEIDRVKRKAKQEKSVILRQKSVLDIEIAKLRADNARLKVQCEELKKEDEKSPLNILKNELDKKNLQIRELGRQLQKCNEVKEQYKIYYGKMKDEVLTLREKLSQKEEVHRELKHEKDIITNNLKHMEQQLSYERQQQQNQQRQHQTHHGGFDRFEFERQDIQPMGLRQKLIRKRNDLIEMGGYGSRDPLILELDREIQNCS